jgi:hypothetical protein
MKIFEFDSPDAMRDGAVARQVDGDGNPVNEDNTPIVTADSLFGNDNVSEEEAERNARLARENAEMLAEEEEKMVEQNHGLKFAIRPIKQFSIGRVEFPKDNTEVGAQLKTVFEQIGKTYLKQGYNRDADTDCFQCWTNHAYAGDYNPYHDHGVQTPAGLSGFLWLKNPECIEDLDANIAPMSNASGSVDGFTHLIWGNNTRKDMMSLHDASEEYVKPEVGVMLVFPNWLKHQVMPFFGEGERRSIAMNWNVTDTEQQLRLFMSEREEKQYDEYLETKKANDE